MPPGFSQEDNPGPDYKVIFGGDYTFAQNLIDQHAWWSDTLVAHGLDACFALSVIFPELIRYSGILNYLETKGLEVLYVQYGTDYADFSIGFFQMKPSFAERIEADILRYGLDLQFPELSGLRPVIMDNAENRRDRIIRLKDEYGQLLYLEAFIRIMDCIYADWVSRMPVATKLQFYSTAYNAGYFKGIDVVREEMKQKRFYRGMEAGVEKFSYWDIAVYHYRH